MGLAADWFGLLIDAFDFRRILKELCSGKLSTLISYLGKMYIPFEVKGFSPTSIRLTSAMHAVDTRTYYRLLLCTTYYMCVN